MNTCYPDAVGWLVKTLDENTLVMRTRLDSFAFLWDHLEAITWEGLFGNNIGQVDPLHWALAMGLQYAYEDGDILPCYPGWYTPWPVSGQVELERDYLLWKVSPHGIRTRVGGSNDDFSYDYIEAIYRARPQWLAQTPPTGDYVAEAITMPTGEPAIQYYPTQVYWDSSLASPGVWMHDFYLSHPGVGDFWELQFRPYVLPMLLQQYSGLFIDGFYEYRFIWNSPLYLLSRELFQYSLFEYLDYSFDGWFKQAGSTPAEKLQSRQDMYALLEVHTPDYTQSLIEEPSHRFFWYGQKVEPSITGTVDPGHKYCYGGGFVGVDGGMRENDSSWVVPLSKISAGGMIPIVGTIFLLGLLGGQFDGEN